MKTRDLFCRVVTVMTLVAVLLPQGVGIPARSAQAQGRITFPEHTIASNLDSPESVYATDLDSDGDVDALGTSANADDITWWKNDGGENFAQHTISPSAVAGNVRSTADLPTLYIDLRDHGPDPETAIVLVGQEVVWTNNGTGNHTVTEGSPVLPVYLPIILRGASTSAPQSTGATNLNLDQSPIFDSGTIAPGEQYTHTFTTTGTFAYYSAYSLGHVVGTVVVVQPGETVSQTVEMDSAATISTNTGASLEVGAGVLLTDTVATITEIPGTVLTDTSGTPIGTVHSINIAHSDDVISGYVTVTLPYDSTRLPDGRSEEDVRAYYHSGVRWVSVGGQVDSMRNVVVVTMTHLSEMQTQVSCENPFGLTQAEEDAFDKAAAYMARFVAAEDLFKAFETSNHQHLFEVDYDNAQWLAEHTLCDLAQMTQDDLPMDKTPAEVVDDMVESGQRLESIGDEIGEWQQFIEEAEELGNLMKALEVCEWLAGGPLGVTAKYITVDVVLFTVLKIGVAFAYSGEMHDVKEGVDAWLQTADEAGLWPSDWNVYPANEIQIDECRPGYQATGDFYLYQVQGIGDLFGPDYSYAYANLYQDGTETDFVLALQNLGPFRGGLLDLGDHTDYVYLLIEYEDTNKTRASAIRFANPGIGWFGVCVVGRVELPDIRPGSEVKVKYIFVEDGHLDKRFNPAGTSSFPAGTLYNDPITMDQVYTADYWGDLQDTFKPGEAIKLTLLATNHSDVAIPVTYTWSTYDPNGAKLSYLSWDGWAVSMSPGEDKWWLTRGIASDALLGTYTYTATVSYASGTSAGSTTFTVQGTPISINLLEALTCKDVQDNKPVNVTNTFTTDDAYVYAWTAWEGASGAHTIRWEWYRPDGTLFGTLPHDFNASGSLYYLWSWVSTSAMGNYPGQWSVRFYMDGSYKGTLYFTLAAGAQSQTGDKLQLSTPEAGAAGGVSLPIQPASAPVKAEGD